MIITPALLAFGRSHMNKLQKIISPITSADIHLLSGNTAVDKYFTKNRNNSYISLTMCNLSVIKKKLLTTDFCQFYVLSFTGSFKKFPCPAISIT